MERQIIDQAYIFKLVEEQNPDAPQFSGEFTKPYMMSVFSILIGEKSREKRIFNSAFAKLVENGSLVQDWNQSQMRFTFKINQKLFEEIRTEEERGLYRVGDDV
tara:strand:- start:754 stop:1065 length:312 start_codon:yes stop_codon:yes gene_type:complete